MNRATSIGPILKSDPFRGNITKMARVIERKVGVVSGRRLRTQAPYLLDGVLAT